MVERGLEGFSRRSLYRLAVGARGVLPKTSMTFCRSCQACFFASGVRSR